MKKKAFLITLVLLLLLAATSFSALAAGGTGTGGGSGGGSGSGAGNGDGSGGGSTQALALDSSSVTDGAKDVAINAVITLTFNKNVVDLTVKDKNLTCFTMKDAAGKDVSITVGMGDDQVNPDIKRIVTITPKSQLQPGSKYTLLISKALTSKSGDALPADIQLSFTTVAGQAAASGQASSAPATAAASTASSAPSASVKPAASSTPVVSAAAETSTQTPGAFPWVILAIIVVAAAVVVLIVLVSKKKK